MSLLISTEQDIQHIFFVITFSDIYRLQNNHDNSIVFCRPALADDVKVGYFNIDRACQTHQTDVVQLKEMTEVVQGLIKVE